MKILRDLWYLAALEAAVLVTSGCGAPSTQIVAPDAALQGPLSRAVVPWLRPFVLADTAKASGRDRISWMARDATVKNLLYASSGGADEVGVYSYPAGNSVGKLTGFQSPAGLCADQAGNVWIVDSASNKIVEYSHGAKKPESTLSPSGALNLLGCSVDPTTGNLAITDLGGPSGGGSVWIYLSAKGTAKNYQDSKLQFAYFCGYDDKGNLFVDGLNSSYAFAFVELPVGSGSLKSISLNQSVGFPGGVQWDGKYVAIGDQFYKSGHTSVIYQISVSGSSGAVEGTTPLAGSCDVLQFWISSLGSRKRDTQGGSVVAPDDCESTV